MSRRKLLRFAEVAAWTTGLLCSAILMTNWIEVAAAQRSAAAMQGHSNPVLLASSRSFAPAANSDSVTDQSKILGRMEIPALHLTTPIVDDDDKQSLLSGAGHIRGTAMPGGLGNFVVAAHRDTFFRPLSGIKPGMHIRVVTPDETFIYIVDSMKIVMPEQVDVLDVGNVPQMTLITCYPFHYIGAAPLRFAVSAHLVSF